MGHQPVGCGDARNRVGLGDKITRRSLFHARTRQRFNKTLYLDCRLARRSLQQKVRRGDFRNPPLFCRPLERFCRNCFHQPVFRCHQVQNRYLDALELISNVDIYNRAKAMARHGKVHFP